MTKSKSGINILGLGPGDPTQLTRAAWDFLTEIDEIYVRTMQHPTLSGLPKNIKIISFDSLYENSEKFENVYEEIIERVLELGRRKKGVSYAVPGHPFVAEATCPEIIRRANALGIPVRVIEGLSFLEPTFTALQLDPFPKMVLLDALELANRQMPDFAPDQPAIISQIYSREVAAEVKITLMTVYPDEYNVKLVHGAGTNQQLVEELKLFEIDRSKYLGLLSSLYLPSLESGTSFEAFQEIIARLRAPEGCAWDREQTHLSLRPHLLEETYEAIEAMDSEDPSSLVEELGDLLLQIVLNTQIASENGDFRMTDVLRGIYEKIIRRHPHVFSNISINNSDEVLRNWERIKELEREESGKSGIKGILEGVPKSLPALSLAQEYQDRAARVGFDWPEITPVWDKVHEELHEVFKAENDTDRADELGDLLFAMVNVIRWYKLDAESILRSANNKFRRRFKYVEDSTQKNGRNLSDMTLVEMDQYWNEAKNLEQ